MVDDYIKALGFNSNVFYGFDFGKDVNDTDLSRFQEELENQKLKKGKVKKVWENPRFERKCK